VKIKNWENNLKSKFNVLHHHFTHSVVINVQNQRIFKRQGWLFLFFLQGFNQILLKWHGVKHYLTFLLSGVYGWSVMLPMVAEQSTN